MSGQCFRGSGDDEIGPDRSRTNRQGQNVKSAATVVVVDSPKSILRGLRGVVRASHILKAHQFAPIRTGIIGRREREHINLAYSITHSNVQLVLEL